ncbi:nitrogen permease regulator 2, partial [Lecanoromycetidae sp. Uapishka_2]
MLKAIFFATFDVVEGPKVLHQVPTSSITASPSTPAIPLLHFPPIANTLIPGPSLCNIGLLHLTTSHHRILSYPQSISSSSYPRNAYTFNFCLVLAEEAEFSSYIPVVRKLNTLFRTLEEQSQFLSQDESLPNTGKIYALCEILLEDLNNYSEAMIPIDAANTLNIKLFPTYPPPPPLYAHHVPLSTVQLENLVDENWDLTMLRILPWIDGVNSVKQISLLADADFKLVKKAIRHLLYYGCVLLLDIFSFSAIYAPTESISDFVENELTQEECARYVALPDTVISDEDGGLVSGTQLAELYLSLRQGQSVKSWCIEHAEMVSKIDVRRFITFGVIKGFLYRVHKYVFATSKKRAKGLTRENFKHAKRKEKEGKPQSTDEHEIEDMELEKYLDGTHCFDEICTDLMISEKELLGRLKSWGEVQILCR